MKKTLSILTMAALLVALVPSCNKTTPENNGGKDNGGDVTPDPTPDPTPAPDPVDYTILFYGCGGGNLDSDDENNLKDVAKALPEKDSKVRFLAQYKYSSPKSVTFTPADEDDNYVAAGQAGHLYRYEVTAAIVASDDESSTYIKLPQGAQYGNQNAKAELFQPDSIASFIKYGVATAPAKNYILVFGGHGNGYNLYEDIPWTESKTTVSDENLEDDPSVSMYHIKEGIKRSGATITLLAFESCEMGQIEVVAELQNSAKYMMASGHSISALAYNELISSIQKGDKFMDIMISFARGSLNDNLPRKGGHMNFSVTDFSKTQPFFTALKEITDYLCNNVKEDKLEGYKTAAADTYQFDKEDSKFDIYDYLCFLGRDVYSEDAEYTRLLENVTKTLNEAQPIHYNSLDCKGDKYYAWLSYSVVMGAQGYMLDFQNKGQRQIARDKNGTTYRLVNNVVGDQIKEDSYGAWAKTYNLTTFDKTVGWSKWFEKNPAFPRNNPPFYLYQRDDR